MNQLPPLKPTGSAKPSLPTNPLARALAETEQSLGRGGQSHTDSTSLFSDALAKAGGNFDFNNFDNNSYDQQDALAEQQRQAEAQRKKELMRRKLHDQVNPVDLVDVYNAREKKVKEEIDKLRSELQLLVQEVKKFDNQVQLTLMTEVAHPGQDGKYYITFFQQLRTFIMLLRQKIKSASTWATQLNGKKKKRSKTGPNLNMAGAAYEKTSTVQDMMHHERSTQFGGG